MNASEILDKYKQTIELHAFSAAYAITPTLVNFYRENVADTQTIQQHYLLAFRNALDAALASEPVVDSSGISCRVGENTVLFRFQARVKVYDSWVSFDYNFVMNGATVKG